MISNDQLKQFWKQDKYFEIKANSPSEIYYPTQSGVYLADLLTRGSITGLATPWDVWFRVQTSIRGRSARIRIAWWLDFISTTGGVIKSFPLTSEAETGYYGGKPQYWYAPRAISIDPSGASSTYFLPINGVGSGLSGLGNQFNNENNYLDELQRQLANPAFKTIRLRYAKSSWKPTSSETLDTDYTIESMEIQYHKKFIKAPEFSNPGSVPIETYVKATSSNISDEIKIAVIGEAGLKTFQSENTSRCFLTQNGTEVALPGEIKTSDFLFSWPALDRPRELVFTIPPNTLTAGALDVLAGVYYEYPVSGDGAKIKAGRSYTAAFQLVDTRPSLSSLEPNGVTVNIQNQIEVSWASENQEQFRLEVNTHKFNGATEKTFILPANTLKKGKNTIKLVVSNSTAAFAQRELVAEVTGFGKPAAPVFTQDNAIYNTAKPTITWSSDEQHSYRVTLRRGDVLVHSTGVVVSSERSFTPQDSLDNNTTYTIRVWVRNDKGLWSEFSKKDFTISFAELAPAELNLFQNADGGVTVNAINPPDSMFSHCEVYRRSEFSDQWSRIAKEGGPSISFNDKLLAPSINYYYKVISYNDEGGSVESAIKEIRVTLSENEFISLSTMDSLRGFYSRSDSPPFGCQRVTNRKAVLFEGNRAPVIEYDGVDYSVYEFTVVFQNYEAYRRFVKASDDSALLLFRSPQGHCTFGIITHWGDERIDTVGYVEVHFTFTEVEFRHSEIYDNGKLLKVIKTDSGYTIGAE